MHALISACQRLKRDEPSEQVYLAMPDLAACLPCHLLSPCPRDHEQVFEVPERLESVCIVQRINSLGNTEGRSALVIKHYYLSFPPKTSFPAGCFV